MGKMMKDLNYGILGPLVSPGQNNPVPAIRREMNTKEGKDIHVAKTCISSPDLNNMKTEGSIK